MLVLSRQRDETIMIGDDIEITVVDIRGDKVRLGISAPTRISVHRKEVYEAIKAENQRAAQINNADLSQLRETGTAPSSRPRSTGLTPSARLRTTSGPAQSSGPPTSMKRIDPPNFSSSPPPFPDKGGTQTT